MKISILAGVCVLAASGLAQVPADHGYGPVDPVALPDVVLTSENGLPVRLRSLTANKRTAVQFIFTHCPTACPLLGSLFAKVDRTLAGDSSLLLSISVDPARDTPERLLAWRRQFGRSDRWMALRPDAASLAALLKVFGQKDGPPSGHALQVFYVDGESRYVARTTDLPRAAGIANALAGRFEMAGRGPAKVFEEGTNTEASGEAIYHQALGVVPRVNGEIVAATAARCANCHGAAGEGRREGELVAAALRGGALTELRPRRGGPPSRYTRDTFCQSLGTGIDPAGVMLDAAMPRYAASAKSCTALWQYLTTGEASPDRPRD
ncbi:MAG: SCO family protein [Bryobacteraceae bacterium]|nr:SCO family protein [Bryobacteraceae bacterium]